MAESLRDNPKIAPHMIEAPKPPELTQDVELQYLAEGGANIIFSIHPATPEEPEHSEPSEDRVPPKLPAVPPIIPQNSGFHGKLLRVRKDASLKISSEDIFRNIERRIGPLFHPHHLIEHELISLPPGLPQALNAKLQKMETCLYRAKERMGTYVLETEEQGLLITDMRPADPTLETLVQFKPKWLVQSPLAPKDARRCRDCALRVYKQANFHSEGGLGYCPFWLVSFNEAEVANAVTMIAYGQSEQVKGRVFDFLLRNPLLGRLQEVQHRYPPRPAAKTLDDLSLAMTLRDCTLFLKVSRPESLSQYTPSMISVLTTTQDPTRLARSY